MTDSEFLESLMAKDELGRTDLERAREIGRRLPRTLMGVPCETSLAVTLQSGREVVLYDSASPRERAHRLWRRLIDRIRADLR